MQWKTLQLFFLVVAHFAAYSFAQSAASSAGSTASSTTGSSAASSAGSAASSTGSSAASSTGSSAASSTGSSAASSTGSSAASSTGSAASSTGSSAASSTGSSLASSTGSSGASSYYYNYDSGYWYPWNLTEPYPVIPLAFIHGYDTLTSIQFTLTDAKQLPSLLVPLIYSDSAVPIKAFLQVGWSKTWDTIQFGGSTCSVVDTDYPDMWSTYTDFSTYYYGYCGLIGMCNGTYSIAVNSVSRNNATVVTPYSVFPITVGPSFFADPTTLCGSYPLTVVVTFDAPVLREPLNAFLAFIVEAAAMTMDEQSISREYFAAGTPVTFVRAPQLVTLKQDRMTTLSGAVYSYLPNGASELDVLTLSNVTSNTSECVVHDVNGFVLQLNRSYDISDYYHDCYAISNDNSIYSVADAQAKCLSDAGCLGITSYIYNSSLYLQEYPLCMLREGSYDPGYGIPRMLYIRRTQQQRTCSVVTEMSGTIDIWVEQTSSDTSFVDVYVDGFFEKSCGTRDNAFASGVSGSSGKCGVFNLCFSGKTYPNAIVEVIPQSNYGVGSASSSCTGALRVIFSQTIFDSNPVEDTRPRYVPPSSLQYNFASDFNMHRLIELKYNIPTLVTVYVKDIMRAALKLSQTGYSCNISDPSCPSSIVGTYFDDSYYYSEYCGGQTLFNGYDGLSDQCSTQYFCGEALTTWGYGISGWIYIWPNISYIFSQAHKCQYFTSTSYLSSKDEWGYSTSATTTGFVFSATDSTFRAMLAAPWSWWTQDVVDRYFTNTTSEWPEWLPGVDVKSDWWAVYYVNWKNIPRTLLNSTMSQACLMDWISSDFASCTFVVPAGANHVTMSVEQSRFAEPNNFITVFFNTRPTGAARSFVSSTLQCGGKFGFDGKAPLHEECYSYLNCTDQFLYVNDSLMDSAPVESITISVPRTVSAGQPCWSSAVIVADFSFVDVPRDATCEYMCSVSRTCITYEQVCDGFNDCRDGADELNCTSFSVAENEMKFAAPDANTTWEEQTYLDCVRRALGMQSTFFAHAIARQECIVYTPANATLMAENASSFLVDDAAFTLYRSRFAKYSRCTSVNTCSGNGIVKIGSNGQCSCFCEAGFEGTDCSSTVSMTSFGGTTATFPTAAQTQMTDIMSDVSSAFGLWEATGLICNNVFQVDAASVAVVCTGEVSTRMRDALQASDALTIFNSLLKPETDRATSVGIYSVPKFQTLSTCTLNGTASCPLPAASAIKNAIFSWQQSGTPSLSVNVGIAASRRSGATTQSFSCDTSSAVVLAPPSDEACGSFSCLIPVSATGVSSLSATVNAPPTPQCTPSVSSVSFSSLLPVPPVTQPTRVANLDTNYTPFLIGGIVLLIVAAFTMFASFGFFWTDMKAIEELTRDTLYSSRSKLNKMLRITFLKMGWYQREDVVVRNEKLSVATLVVTVSLIITGVFLILFFATASGYSSDTSIIVEQYVSSSCDAAVVAGMPFQSFMVDGNSGRECKQREVVGISTTALYAAGHCEVIGGQLVALLRVGVSSATCASQAVLKVPSHTCLSSAGLIPGVNDTTHAKVSCGTLSAVAQRFQFFSSLADSLQQSATLLVESLPLSLLQSWSNSSLMGNGTYTLVGMNATGSVSTTSSMQSTFESMAPTIGNTTAKDVSEIVVQLPNETFETRTSPFYSASTAAFEYDNTNSSLSQLLINESQRCPRDGDLPWGALFNQFNTSTAKSGIDASAGSEVYYDIISSAVDLGAWYGEKTKPGEGDGVTISLYLRATTDTTGFAFAVTDAYENFVTKSSPLVDKAISIISSGASSESWFSRAYHIYSSLYVDGPSQTLHFVQANPKTIVDGNKSSSDASLQRFVDVKWDLSALGLDYLFNGLWHHVVIILRTQNEQTKAQLMVDGTTSLSARGWNLCLSRRPTKIQNVTTGMTAPAYSASEERFYTRGALRVGYLNGGVGHLRFRSTVVPKYKLWLEATETIAAHNTIPTEKYTALGWVMIALAVTLALYMATTSSLEIWQNHVEEGTLQQQAAEASYTELMKRKKTSHKPIPFSQALEWLDLTTHQFQIFLTEIHASSADPTAELFRVLYMVRKAAKEKSKTIDLHTRMPTVAEWNSSVEENKKTSAWQRLKNKVKDHQVADETKPAQTAIKSMGQLVSVMFRKKRRSTVHEEERENEDERMDGGGGGGTVDVSKMGTVKVDTKASNSVSTTSGTAVSLDSNLPPAMKELAAPVLLVIQSVYVWLNAIPFPHIYDLYFRSLFSFISIDWAVSFPQIPTIITPLLQFFAGMAVFAFLVYHAKMDEYRFAWHLARYVLRRDAHISEDKKEHVANTSFKDVDVVHVSELFTTFAYPFGTLRGTDYEYNVSVLPVSECQKIDRFVGLSTVDDREDGQHINVLEPNGAQTLPLHAAPQLQIHDALGNEFILSKPIAFLPPDLLIPELIIDPVDHARPNTLQADSTEQTSVIPVTNSEPAVVPEPMVIETQPPVESDQPDSERRRLEPLGVYCREHPDRLLVAQVQSSVWPYIFPPACCVVANGRRCNAARGVIYSCGNASLNEDGSTTMCDYAVCEHHCRHSPAQLIKSSLLEIPRQVERQGASWLVATLLLLIANAVYTPFMQTALMILACSPFYQCEFQHCWGSTMDQKFSLAVYLCLVVVALLGVGLPALQTSQLRRCRQMMRTAFFADEYHGLYEESESDDEERPADHEEDEVEKLKRKLQAKKLKLAEWIRFTTSDFTVMGTLYKSLEFEWLFLSPIILAWKVVLIVPAVFIQVDTFEQRVGIAAVQVAFAAFIFLTAPFISPIVDAMYRLGCVHQILFLGVESLNVVALYRGESGYSLQLITITLVYLCFALVFMLWSNVAPVVRQILDTKQTTKVLKHLGFQYSMSTSIYVSPRPSSIDRVTRDPVADTFGL